VRVVVIEVVEEKVASLGDGIGLIETASSFMRSFRQMTSVGVGHGWALSVFMFGVGTLRRRAQGCACTRWAFLPNLPGGQAHM
jgi:hypothetical protein